MCKKRVLLLSCLLLFSVLAVANFSNAKVKVLKISNKKFCAEMKVGEKAKIKAKANVKWKSSNKKVAVVSSKGVIRAKKAGKVKITAYGSKKKRAYNIKVIKNTDKKQAIQPTPEMPVHFGNYEPTTAPVREGTPEPTPIKVEETPEPTPRVIADTWLLFGVDQKYITPQTTLLTGIISFKEYESVIRVYINGTLIAEKYLVIDEEAFSVEVDFSQCQAGDKIIVSRVYTGKRDANSSIGMTGTKVNSSLTVWNQSIEFTMN